MLSHLPAGLRENGKTRVSGHEAPGRKLNCVAAPGNQICKDVHTHTHTHVRRDQRQLSEEDMGGGGGSTRTHKVTQTATALPSGQYGNND